MSGEIEISSERRGDMMDLIKNLATLNERLGNLVTTFEKQTEVYDKKFEVHESRILSVERFQMKIVGAFAVISILLQLGFNMMNAWHNSNNPLSNIKIEDGYQLTPIKK